MRDAHLRSVECYQLALPLMRPTGERVSIPFEGKTLYGILRRPAGATGRSPVLIMAPGLDSTKEELHAYAEPFLARGVAILAIDGPGQGEAEYEIPICGDYERAARAVCDWVEKRADLDAAKIAMWGVSLGGYYAPRATAYEKRIRPASRSPGRSSGRKSGARRRLWRAGRSARAAIRPAKPPR